MFLKTAVKNYIIKQYQKENYDAWNAFISNAKNATFLFHRDYMEYHADRFEDCSLLVFEKDKLVAVLPANKVGTTVFSHQGLTYGGLVLLPKSKLYTTIFAFKAILSYLNENKIDHLYLKQIPSIYCDFPSEEINYLMFICNGTVKMRHNVSTISLKTKIDISRIRKRGIEKGIKNDLKIKQETDLTSFWNTLLIPNLAEKYNAKPVHTIDEIHYLIDKFPNNIHHYNVYYNNAIVAGITLFVNKIAVKSQYISGCEWDDKLGSLDFLTDFVIKKYASSKSYLDFGPSHENNGLNIVENLNYFKESFGAHSIVQDFYEVATASHPLLDTILI